MLLVATSVSENAGAKPQTVHWNLRLDVSDVDGNADDLPVGVDSMRNAKWLVVFDVPAPLATIAALAAIGAPFRLALWWVSDVLGAAGGRSVWQSTSGCCVVIR